jgi:hypothetical protein
MPDGSQQLDRQWRALNPQEYWSLFNNKLIFNRYFGAIGLPVTTVLGLFDPRFGATQEGSPLRTAEELTQLLLRQEAGGFVMKHVEGMRGTEVFVFCDVEPVEALPLKHVDGRRFDVPSLLAEMLVAEEKRSGSFRCAWIVEKRIEPHSEIARLCGPTLSCVRMQTFVEENGHPRLVASMIKIPNRARAVDNLHFGGIGIWVDPETGVLGRGRSMKEKEINWLTSLPWNGIEFYGLQLPFWMEARDIALQAAAAFPWTRCIGWDVAITQTGPVLIEGNERFSPRLVQSVAPQGLLVGGIKALCEKSRNGPRLSYDT